MSSRIESAVPARVSAPTVRHPYATAPAWSLVALLISTSVMLELIPESRLYFEPSALLPAALALTLGLAAGPALSALRSPAALFRAENLLSLGLVYWLLLDVLIGHGGIGVSHDALVQAFLGIAVFAAAMWTGSVVAGVGLRDLPEARARPQQPLGARFLFVAALISGVLGISRVLIGCGFAASCLAEAYYQPRFAAPWQQVDAFGPFDTLFLYTRYFGFIVLPLTVGLLHSEGRVTWRSFTTFVLGMACLAFFVGEGGRREVGTAIGASLLVWVLLRRRIAFRQIAGVSLAALALVLLMQFMLVARDHGVVGALTKATEARPAPPVGVVDRNLRFLAHIVQLVPDKLPYSGWQGVAYATTTWIPSDLIPRSWQRRSVNLPYELGLDVGERYTWTCSVIGDLYLIGGFAVIMIGGLLFGVGARLVSRLLARRDTVQGAILYALLTMTLFLSLRALHELFVTGFIVLAFAGLLLLRARRHATG